jgi:hypothetical protein
LSSRLLLPLTSAVMKTYNAITYTDCDVKEVSVNKYASKKFGISIRQRSQRYVVVIIAILLSLVSMTIIWKLSQSASAQTERLWNIGSRTLPSPVGVSDELHEAIANIEAAIAGVPKNLDEWRASIARQAEGSAILAQELALGVYSQLSKRPLQA